MRFKSQIKNVGVFAKFCASLASLHQIAWCRLNDDDVRFTVLPEKGSQAWSVLKLETVFDTYILQSASPKNTINLEVPIQALQRALKSALGATSVELRLTKKDNIPMLSLTIVTNTLSSGNGVVSANPANRISDEYGDFDFDEDFGEPSFGGTGGGLRERETIITQDVPVKVLPVESVMHLHAPTCPPSDVNIFLPNLAQVKTVSERFTKLAIATQRGTNGSYSPRLELSANMHGSFKISIKTDALSIASRWTGLSHPELDVAGFENGSQGIKDDPSTKKKELGGPDGEDPAGWTAVRIDAKDWSRVLSVGRLHSRVIATFIPDHGLVLYVYLPAEDQGGDESVLTLFQRLIDLPSGAHEFVFLYRSRKALNMGCIPNTPSPPPDATLMLKQQEQLMRDIKVTEENQTVLENMRLSRMSDTDLRGKQTRGWSCRQ